MSSGKKLNVYGDQAIHKQGRFGHDIASQRLDDLDRAFVRFLLDFPGAGTATTDKSNRKPVVADLGCGEARVGFLAAILGARVHLVDVLDIMGRLTALRMVTESVDVVFHHESATDFAIRLDERVDAIYSQRFIHYLRFPDADAMIRVLTEKMVPGSRLFLSASGLGSELGERYPCATHPVENRFAPLDASMAAKHNIHGPVCLYTLDDMEKLVLPHGLRTIQIQASPFGNVKAVFEKII